MDLSEAADIIKKFETDSLGRKLSNLEAEIKGLDKDRMVSFFSKNALDTALLEASYELKRLAGQINVIVHAAGILYSLPHILKDDEEVEYVSLGAGNTGRKFDLVTNQRIAEFKFINWRGGAEAIRQNSLFKDFYYLACEETDKEKFLYVLGLEKPLKFFNGKRSLSSVLSRNSKLREDFIKRYRDSFSTVTDYYRLHKKAVEIVDLCPVLPQLTHAISAELDEKAKHVSKEASSFWVYENWTHEKAVIHIGDCRYCQNGQGLHGTSGNGNDKWHGPFQNIEQALRIAENTGRNEQKICGKCML